MQIIKGWVIMTGPEIKKKFEYRRQHYLTKDFLLQASFTSDVMLFNTEAEAHFIGGSLYRPYKVRFLNEVVP